jgi:hypothetical protein
MRIDKPWCHDAVSRVDNPLSALADLADLRDLSRLNRDVSTPGRRAGSIDNRTVLDQ